MIFLASRKQRRGDSVLARLMANPADTPAAETTVGAGAAPTAGEFSLLPAKRVALPNGLVLLLWENHRLPIVVAEVHVNDVSLARAGGESRRGNADGELAG